MGRPSVVSVLSLLPGRTTVQSTLGTLMGVLAPLPGQSGTVARRTMPHNQNSVMILTDFHVARSRESCPRSLLQQFHNE